MFKRCVRSVVVLCKIVWVSCLLIVASGVPQWIGCSAQRLAPHVVDGSHRPLLSMCQPIACLQPHVCLFALLAPIACMLAWGVGWRHVHSVLAIVCVAVLNSYGCYLAQQYELWWLAAPCREREDPSYHSEHCELFRESCLSWPPNLSDFSHINMAGMNQRVAEVVVLMDHMFPVEVGTNITKITFEFFDANPSMKRLITRDTEGNYKSPWVSHPNTLTGQTKLIVRTIDPAPKASVNVRRVDIAEIFSFIGWFPDAWSHRTPELAALDILLASSLAGNAFSAFHLGPVMMAFLASAIPGAMCGGDIDVAREVVTDDDQGEHSSVVSVTSAEG